MTLTGSIVFLLFRLAEPITKRYFSASWHYNLLKCVALFFCIPFGQLNHLFSLNKFYKSNLLVAVAPAKEQGATAITGIMNNFKQFGVHKDLLISYLVIIWVTGMIILLFWQSLCYINFRFTISVNKYRANPELQKIAELCAKQLKIKKSMNIWVNEFIDTPMMIGFMSPVILIPSDKIDAESAKHVLTHELIHFKSKDLFVKFGMLLIRILHWYNPFIYLLFKELEKWCEYTCDEKNVIHLSQDIRKQYGRVILDAISVMPSYGSRYGSPFLLPKQRLKERLIFMFSVKKMRKRVKILALSYAVTLMTFGITAAFATELTSNFLTESTVNADSNSINLITYENTGVVISDKEGKLNTYIDTITP